MHRRKPRVLHSFAVALLIASGAVGLARPATADVAAQVTVNAQQSLGTIPATGVGVNTAVYDGLMNDASAGGLLGAAGVGALRYPGGSYGDIYHWQTNTADGGFVAPNTDFDTFMGTANAAGAQPIIIADYGSGTPQEAADWVRYANVTKGYGVKYWEIGNEVYGNGHYGAQWEQDNHADKSPAAYAQGVLQYASAMKAVDPSIKVGVVLTTPGFWPDGVVGSGDSADWNNTVLSAVASKIDFAVVHWYPGSGTTAADTLATPSKIPGEVAALRGLLNQYGGDGVQIAVTETNASVDMDTQPGALFAPDTVMSWLENGVFNVDWWNEHNGAGTVSTVQGATDYGDEGILSNASCSGGTCEPAAQTPFGPYYGIQMLTKLGAPGDTMVGSSSDQPLLAAHAVRRANGDLDVLLINKDPGSAATVTLSYSGFTPATGTPTVSSYGLNATSITSAQQGTGTTQTIPAYSMVTVQLHPTG